MGLRRSLTLVALALGTVLTLTTVAVAQPATAPAPKLDVPYVPTHERIVNEMLTVANVGKNDVLYDLGCGDGRIPITAAKRFGTRGVGVDIDPQRVTEARESAVKEGVADRVKFFQQDLFETDIKDATVVTLYLLPDVNLRLRPKLLSDLKPGTRVVSHNYDMGDWKPLKTITIKLPDGDHTVYFWVVPPRAAGK
jgi:SAM-dependent methyltransferase